MGVFIFIINTPTMKKFSMKTKLGERIFSIEANNLEEAYKKFQFFKKLPINLILEIFIVEED
jgi:hypothetical protein